MTRERNHERRDLEMIFARREEFERKERRRVLLFRLAIAAGATIAGLQLVLRFIRG